MCPICIQYRKADLPDIEQVRSLFNIVGLRRDSVKSVVSCAHARVPRNSVRVSSFRRS